MNAFNLKKVNTLRNRGKSKNCQEGSSKYHKEVEAKNTCFGRQLSHAYILCFSDKKAEIDSLAAEYIESVKNMLPEERVEHLKKIQSAYSKCKEYSDDKVQLAMQTYEMVRITTSETFVKMIVLWNGAAGGHGRCFHSVHFPSHIYIFA